MDEILKKIKEEMQKKKKKKKKSVPLIRQKEISAFKTVPSDLFDEVTLNRLEDDIKKAEKKVETSKRPATKEKYKSMVAALLKKAAEIKKTAAISITGETPMRQVAEPKEEVEAKEFKMERPKKVGRPKKIPESEMVERFRQRSLSRTPEYKKLVESAKKQEKALKDVLDKQQALKEANDKKIKKKESVRDALLRKAKELKTEKAKAKAEEDMRISDEKLKKLRDKALADEKKLEERRQKLAQKYGGTVDEVVKRQKDDIREASQSRTSESMERFKRVFDESPQFESLLQRNVDEDVLDQINRVLLAQTPDRPERRSSLPREASMPRIDEESLEIARNLMLQVREIESRVPVSPREILSDLRSSPRIEDPMPSPPKSLIRQTSEEKRQKSEQISERKRKKDTEKKAKAKKTEESKSKAIKDLSEIGEKAKAEKTKKTEESKAKAIKDLSEIGEKAKADVKKAKKTEESKAKAIKDLSEIGEKAKAEAAKKAEEAAKKAEEAAKKAKEEEKKAKAKAKKAAAIAKLEAASAAIKSKREEDARAAKALADKAEANTKAKEEAFGDLQNISKNAKKQMEKEQKEKERADKEQKAKERADKLKAAVKLQKEQREQKAAAEAAEEESESSVEFIESDEDIISKKPPARQRSLKFARERAQKEIDKAKKSLDESKRPITKEKRAKVLEALLEKAKVLKERERIELERQKNIDEKKQKEQEKKQKSDEMDRKRAQDQALREVEAKKLERELFFEPTKKKKETQKQLAARLSSELESSMSPMIQFEALPKTRIQERKELQQRKTTDKDKLGEVLEEQIKVVNTNLQKDKKLLKIAQDNLDKIMRFKKLTNPQKKEQTELSESILNLTDKIEKSQTEIKSIIERADGFDISTPYIDSLREFNLTPTQEIARPQVKRSAKPKPRTEEPVVDLDAPELEVTDKPIRPTVKKPVFKPKAVLGEGMKFKKNRGPYIVELDSQMDTRFL